MPQSTIALIVFACIVGLFIINKFPLWVSALAGLLLMSVTGCITPAEALSGFANSNAIIMMMMFIVAAGLSRTQMVRKISNLTYKVSGGSLTKGMLGYVLVTFIIAQVVPSASTVFIICYPLASDFCRRLGVSPSKAIFSIGLTAISAIGVLPVGSGAVTYLEMNGIMEAYGASQYSFGMFDLFIGRMPMVIAIILYSVFLAPKLAPDKGLNVGMGNENQQAVEKPPLSPVREVLGYGVFFAVVAGLLFESYLPLNSWQICMAGALIIVISGVLNEKEALGAVLLSPVWLYIGALAIGQGLVSTGAGDIISKMVLRILGENPSGLFIGFVFFATSFIFTQFMSNMAMYNAVRPIAILTCASLGFNPMGPIILCFIGSFTAYLTPMATATIPLVIGAGGYNQKDLLRLGWIPALLTAAISIPWVMLMFPVV